MTAIKVDGSFWVQESPVEGYAYSGIFIYNNSIDIGSLGVSDEVTVYGVYQEFFGLSEIVLDNFIISNISYSNIAPVIVNPTDVETSGIDAEKYEGVLVEIDNIAVIDANPEAPENVSEFMVTGNLRVDDELYLLDPYPVLDDTFSSVTGIITYTYTSSASGSNNKLLPRDNSDIVRP